MRSTLPLPLPLLLFLQLTTSAPIPHHRDLDEYQLPFSLSSKPGTPPTFLSNPHFPPHQLPPWDSSSQSSTFDNAPKTPSEISPSAALSAETPLTSAYLLSLTAPIPSTLEPPSASQTEDEEALPSKPTSALPYLRKLDSIRYWASLRPNVSPNPRTSPPTPQKLEQTWGEKEFLETENAISDGPVSSIIRCQEYLLGAGSSAYMSIGLARDYSDLLVVGMVVLFLGLVVVSEVIMKVVDL
jgi:hypothetical protein